MRSLGLVRASREGRRVYYLLDDDHVRTLISQARDHAEHQDQDTQP
jgi:DNA-binding transcriptional ArsR family regulator